MHNPTITVTDTDGPTTPTNIALAEINDRHDTTNPMAVIAAQPFQALTVANERRTATARLKSRLRRGELTLADLLADPPVEAEQALTFEVLLWAPQFGRQRLRMLNPRAVRDGHVNLATPLGELTDRQRKWLAREIQP